MIFLSFSSFLLLFIPHFNHWMMCRRIRGDIKAEFFHTHITIKEERKIEICRDLTNFHHERKNYLPLHDSVLITLWQTDCKTYQLIKVVHKCPLYLYLCSLIKLIFFSLLLPFAFSLLVIMSNNFPSWKLLKIKIEARNKIIYYKLSCTIINS